MEQALSLTAAEAVTLLPARLRAEGNAVLAGFLTIWDVLQRALQVLWAEAAVTLGELF